MDQDIKVTLPKLGESIHSARVVQWFKHVGEYVDRDEPLLEVSTDKVNSEIPSPLSGVLKEIVAEVDQEVAVGAPLALMRAEKGNEPVQMAAPLEDTTSKQEEKNNFLSPAILRLAKENGVSASILETMTGTGTGGRVTKQDLERYIEKSKQRVCAKSANSPDVERVVMTGMRKAIADNMVRSFYGAPHASLVIEVDITEISHLLKKEKEAFMQKHGCKLTLTSFAIRALVRALQEYPMLNSSLDGDTIVVKKFVNVGVAVSVEEGLMVPVLKHCQRMKIAEIAKMLHDVAVRARAGQLKPNEVQEGTVTMTNFGMTGVQIGIPIIRHPEVAIIGLGAAHKKVVPMEDEVIAVRTMMYVSLTFDHRVLDGMYGCGFLNAVKKHLESHPSAEE